MSELLQYVDPIEALINMLKADTVIQSIVGSQVADEQRFGDGWGIDSRAIAVQRDSGTPDIYTPRQVLRVEVHCYGESFLDAEITLSGFTLFTRNFQRSSIASSFGNALIYQVTMATAGSRFIDPDTKQKSLLSFADLKVSELAVTVV